MRRSRGDWFSRRRNDKRAPEAQQPLLEGLEPRLLLDAAVGVAAPYTWFTAENWGVGTVYGTTVEGGVLNKPADEFTEWDGVSTPVPEFWKILPPTNGYGDDSWGLFRMNSMALGRVKPDGYIEKEPDIDPYWQYGSGADEEILGVFYGAADQVVTVRADNTILVKSSGFTLELYEIAKSDLPSGYMSQLLAFDETKRTAADEYDFLDGTIGTPLMKATTTDFTYTSRPGAASLVEGESVFFSNNDEAYGGDWSVYIDDLDHYAFEAADSDIYISWDTDAHDSWMYHSHDEGSFGAVAEPIPAAIGDYVWEDLNVDGIQNDGSTGINGVEVRLYEDVDGDEVAEPGGDDNGPVATTLTADDDGGHPGYYLFDNLAPGGYFVEFVAPSGYVFSPQDANPSAPASDDAVDSDADTVTGQTVVTTLDSGETDLTWDAGMYEEPDGDGRVVPTGTTCQQYIDHVINGNPDDPSDDGDFADGGFNYAARKGKISKVAAPGAAFYYTIFYAPSDSFTVSVDQDAGVLGPGYEMDIRSLQVSEVVGTAPNATCATLENIKIGPGTTDPSEILSGYAGKLLVLRWRINPSSIKGELDPGVTYQLTFKTKVDGVEVDSDPDGVLVIREA